MTPAGPEFRIAYAAGLRAYVAEASESSLHTAYELGREAVVRELSVLDLAAVHHETLLASLSHARDRRAIEQTTRAAGDFFLESLSAFEMVRRGFTEARDAAMAERRQSTMLRQLSSLLADTSLALDESDSLAEALRLVAEEARELTGARWCVATTAFEGGRRLSEVAPASETEGGPRASERSTDLAALHALVPDARDAVRLNTRELAHHPALHALREAEGAPSLRGWMAAPLTSLDGRDFGCLHAFDKEEGEFTELDEAVLVHLAQMASAALERAHLYRGRHTAS